MKSKFHSLLALAAVLTSAAVAADRPSAATPAGNASTAKQPKLVAVGVINGTAAVQEFENNVRILQNERDTVVQLQSSMEKEKDSKKKKELQAQLETALARLNQDNATMTKTYGFTITRNYVMDQSATIYLEATDEEAARVEKAQAEQAKSQQNADTKKAKK
jgi:hypothetical protein